MRERDNTLKWNVLTSGSPVANPKSGLTIKCSSRNSIFLFFPFYVPRKVFPPKMSSVYRLSIGLDPVWWFYFQEQRL
jgi:hypothetical protein